MCGEWVGDGRRHIVPHSERAVDFTASFLATTTVRRTVGIDVCSLLARRLSFSASFHVSHLPHPSRTDLLPGRPTDRPTDALHRAFLFPAAAAVAVTTHEPAMGGYCTVHVSGLTHRCRPQPPPPPRPQITRRTGDVLRRRSNRQYHNIV